MPLRLLFIIALSAFFLWNSPALMSAPTSTEKTNSVDGLTRTYRLFVPAGAKEPLPVVVMLHGGGGSAAQMERYSKFDDSAQRDGFLVIYPEAVDGNWNDGRGMDFIRAQRENIDDVKFIRACIDEVAKDHKLDRSRIFATGISNGGLMSHRLAAEASDLVAGIAPVSGGLAPAIAERFNPKYPVSILIIQGDADPLVPIDGGEISLGFGRKRGKVIPTKDTLGKYLERNGSHGEPTVSILDGDPHDGTTVVISKYPDGPGGVKMEYYLVKNGGHTWPGRPLYLPESIIGVASQKFTASDVICDFFKSCPSRVATPQ